MDNLKASFLKKKKGESVEDYEKRAYKNNGFIFNGRIMPIVAVKYSKGKEGKPNRIEIRVPKKSGHIADVFANLFDNLYNKINDETSDEDFFNEYINSLTVLDIHQSSINNTFKEKGKKTIGELREDGGEEEEIHRHHQNQHLI